MHQGIFPRVLFLLGRALHVIVGIRDIAKVSLFNLNLVISIVPLVYLFNLGILLAIILVDVYRLIHDLLLRFDLIKL